MQAMKKHPKLRRLCAQLHLTAGYLIRKCKEVCPSWRLSPLRLKKEFTPQQKLGRLAYCKKALLRPLEYWKSCIFWDEHTFYRRPSALPTIHLAGTKRGRQPPTSRDKRLKRYPWEHPKLHFGYAVHWKLGVLGPYWISDCKHWRQARSFPVSRGRRT